MDEGTKELVKTMGMVLRTFGKIMLALVAFKFADWTVMSIRLGHADEALAAVGIVVVVIGGCWLLWAIATRTL